jgi:hypothetical protein
LLLRFLARALPLGVQVLRRETYRPWGLIGEDSWFRGVGSFRSSADQPLDETSVEVPSFRHERASNRIIAEIVARSGYERSLNAAVPGILLIDSETSEPAPLRYSGATAIRREAGRLIVELPLPPAPAGGTGRWQAHLLLDTTPLAKLVP